MGFGKLYTKFNICVFRRRFPTSTVEITFANFMFYSIPLMVIVNITLVIIAFLITHMGLFRPNSKTGKIIAEANTNRKLMEDVLRQRHIDLGPMSCHEIQMAIAFAFMIVLLITRKPGFVPGWSDLINRKCVYIYLYRPLCLKNIHYIITVPFQGSGKCIRTVIYCSTDFCLAHPIYVLQVLLR